MKKLQYFQLPPVINYKTSIGAAISIHDPLIYYHTNKTIFSYKLFIN